MIVHTGIITEKLDESKTFYAEYFGFEVIFENDWFVMLKKGACEMAFMRPRQLSQHPLFRSAYVQGTWLGMEVENVDEEYSQLKSVNAPILTDVKDEPWGDRHFVLKDPNGIGVDIFQRTVVMAN